MSAVSLATMFPRSQAVDHPVYGKRTSSVATKPNFSVRKPAETGPLGGAIGRVPGSAAAVASLAPIAHAISVLEAGTSPVSAGSASMSASADVSAVHKVKKTASRSGSDFMNFSGVACDDAAERRTMPSLAPRTFVAPAVSGPKVAPPRTSTTKPPTPRLVASPRMPHGGQQTVMSVRKYSMASDVSDPFVSRVSGAVLKKTPPSAISEPTSDYAQTQTTLPIGMARSDSHGRLGRGIEQQQQVASSQQQQQLWPHASPAELGSLRSVPSTVAAGGRQVMHRYSSSSSVSSLLSSPRGSPRHVSAAPAGPSAGIVHYAAAGQHQQQQQPGGHHFSPGQPGAGSLSSSASGVLFAGLSTSSSSSSSMQPQPSQRTISSAAAPGGLGGTPRSIYHTSSSGGPIHGHTPRLTPVSGVGSPRSSSGGVSSGGTPRSIGSSPPPMHVLDTSSFGASGSLRASSLSSMLPSDYSSEYDAPSGPSALYYSPIRAIVPSVLSSDAADAASVTSVGAAIVSSSSSIDLPAAASSYTLASGLAHHRPVLPASRSLEPRQSSLVTRQQATDDSAVVDWQVSGGSLRDGHESASVLAASDGELRPDRHRSNTVQRSLSSGGGSSISDELSMKQLVDGMLQPLLAADPLPPLPILSPTPAAAFSRGSSRLDIPLVVAESASSAATSRADVPMSPAHTPIIRPGSPLVRPDSAPTRPGSATAIVQPAQLLMAALTPLPTSSMPLLSPAAVTSSSLDWPAALVPWSDSSVGASDLLEPLEPLEPVEPSSPHTAGDTALVSGALLADDADTFAPPTRIMSDAAVAPVLQHQQQRLLEEEAFMRGLGWRPSSEDSDSVPEISEQEKAEFQHLQALAKLHPPPSSPSLLRAVITAPPTVDGVC